MVHYKNNILKTSPCKNVFCTGLFDDEAYIIKKIYFGKLVVPISFSIGFQRTKKRSGHSTEAFLFVVRIAGLEPV